jgi:putative acetyltransferase
MSDKLRIREENTGDQQAIQRVNMLAFAGSNEADLVDTLCAAGAVTLSLVAEQDGIVGHILFSPVTIETPAGISAAVGLAPMAVWQEWQRRGIGSRLVREGLAELRRRGHGVVVVLGHPDYYPRFGFEPASRFGLRWEGQYPDEAFMVVELVPGALSEAGGIVRYRPEFAAV